MSSHPGPSGTPSARGGPKVSVGPTVPQELTVVVRDAI